MVNPPGFHPLRCDCLPWPPSVHVTLDSLINKTKLIRILLGCVAGEDVITLFSWHVAGVAAF